MSLAEVKRSAKQCPGCGMAITKDEGTLTHIDR